MNYYDCILNQIPEHKNIDFDNTTLIAYVHILENNKEFFKSLLSMGVSPKNIIIFGKSYSTNQSVLKSLNDIGFCITDVGYPDRFGDFYNSAKNEIGRTLNNITLSKNIIVMESGGLLRNMVQDLFGNLCNITGVELTSQGTYYDSVFPTINVARSDVKINDEPIIVAKCIVDMLKGQDLMHIDKIYGIIGNGVIGKALGDYMESVGLKTLVYDNQYDKDDVLDSLKSKSDYIIGATGRDCLTDFNDIKNGCRLISVSSGDIEFNSILKRSDIACTKDNIFSDVIVDNLCIVNGGFPITFDRHNGSKDNEIMITYGLWLVGLIQAGLNQNTGACWIDLKKDYQNIVKKCFSNCCS